jgi:hypothetical protein
MEHIDRKGTSKIREKRGENGSTAEECIKWNKMGKDRDMVWSVLTVNLIRLRKA